MYNTCLRFWILLKLNESIGIYYNKTEKTNFSNDAMIAVMVLDEIILYADSRHKVLSMK